MGERVVPTREAWRPRGGAAAPYGGPMADTTTVPTELRTERLLLRQWRPEDREPFAALNDDPAVMEHFPGHLDRAASDAMADRIESAIAAARLGAVGGRGARDG